MRHNITLVSLQSCGDGADNSTDMEQMWILIDKRTGLHVAWYFWLRVLDEVNRATRYGTPFSLLLLEGEIAEPTGRSRQLEDSAAVVPQAIRSTDLGGIVAPGKVAVLLTNQDDDSSELARDRIMERMDAAGAGGVRWVTRLLTHPADAGAISHLLTTGWNDAADVVAGQRPA